MRCLLKFCFCAVSLVITHIIETLGIPHTKNILFARIEIFFPSTDNIYIPFSFCVNAGVINDIFFNVTVCLFSDILL
jgi:hypothetical protein